MVHARNPTGAGKNAAQLHPYPRIVLGAPMTCANRNFTHGRVRPHPSASQRRTVKSEIAEDVAEVWFISESMVICTTVFFSIFTYTHVPSHMCLVTFGDVLSVYCRITQTQAATCEHVTIVYIRHGACRTEQNCGCKQCGNSVQRDSKTKLPVVAISRELCKVVCTRKPIVLQHSLQNLN